MLRVFSEIGRLRKVLVHEPGPEVDRMVPSMMEDLLFDDILFGDMARDEHRRFRRVLQILGIDVLEVADLLNRALEVPEARRFVLDGLGPELSPGARDELEEIGAADLAQRLSGGVLASPAPGHVEIKDLYELPPLPNWCFQRDPQVAIGVGVVFGSMAASARRRETLLARAIFRFHPDLADVPVLAGPTTPNAFLEGGDVLVLSQDVVLVGRSERTNDEGIRSFARCLARREGGPRSLFVVELPRRRAYMHLDTVITPIDHDACLVHAPLLVPGPASPAAPVWEYDLHARDAAPTSRADLLVALADRGLDLEPIPCGGRDPVLQQREQWTDGANALALQPGVILLYDRNLETANELARSGFRIVQADALLLGRDEVRLDDRGRRVCILIPSHEISRARGGPHCLAHPLVRD